MFSSFNIVLGSGEETKSSTLLWMWGFFQ